jgi:hypothetical protein
MSQNEGTSALGFELLQSPLNQVQHVAAGGEREREQDMWRETTKAHGWEGRHIGVVCDGGLAEAAPRAKKHFSQQYPPEFEKRK